MASTATDITVESAVIHNNVRGILIRKASRRGSYSKLPKYAKAHRRLTQSAYPRTDGNPDGRNPTNVTGFLTKDKDVGTERSQRPEILFQIHSNGEQRHEEPAHYMYDDGRVVLDHWMHGIRSFPDILPSTLDSELDG